MTLGQRIQELRKQKGLSQESLGETLGVSRQAVSKWEGDNGIPELDTLIAMSRLFGITVGELLGVEESARPAGEPAQTAQNTDRGEEARIEAILQRYAEQAVPPKDGRPWQKRWGWLAVAAAVVIVLVTILFVQIGSLRSTVRSLRSQITSLEVQVSNNLSGLSGQIRSSIYDILAEQAELLNTFEWTLLDADLEQQTATVRFHATMKEYQAGSKVQFLLDWTKMDESRGKTTGDWVEGPDFSAELTLPMNYHTDVTIRVMDAEGNVQEQLVDALYDFHPENFQLAAYNLMEPFDVTMKGVGWTSTTARGENPHVVLYTRYPQMIWPEKAVITAAVNAETVFSETMTISQGPNEKEPFNASIRDGYFELTLKANDTLEIRLEVTDNFGRVQEFANSGTVVYARGGYLELELVPMEAPVVGFE